MQQKVKALRWHANCRVGEHGQYVLCNKPVRDKTMSSDRNFQISFQHEQLLRLKVLLDF